MKRLTMLLVIAAIILISGCTTEPTPTNNHSSNDSLNNSLEMILISDGGVLSQEDCTARDVQDRVIVFHSSGCPACRIAVPILEELADEMPGVDFEFIELSSNMKRAYELGLMPTHIPTVLVNCMAYTGIKTKEEYRVLIEG